MNVMSRALEELKEGPAVITLRYRAPTVKGIDTGKGSTVVQLDELIEFRAVRWRNLERDGWEFVVEQKHPQTEQVVRVLWYIDAVDILFIQAQSKIA